MWVPGIMYIMHCGYPPIFGGTGAEVFLKVRLGSFSSKASGWKSTSEDAENLIRYLFKMDPRGKYTAEQALNHECDGSVRQGQILEVNKKKAIVQVFEGTSNIDNKNCHVEFTGETLKMPTSDDLMSRAFIWLRKAQRQGAGGVGRRILGHPGAPLNP